MKNVPGKNRGQLLLIQTRKSLGDVAESTGVTRGTVARWRDGKGVPQEAQRAALSETLGIDFEAWEEHLPEGTEIEIKPPSKNGRPTKAEKAAKEIARKANKKTTKKRPPKKRELKYPPPPPDDASILVSMRYSLTCIRYDMRHRDLTNASRSKLRADETRTLSLIAKLQREEELREDYYLKNHPAFREHCQRILEALRPFPAASKAVAAALKNPK